MSEESRSRPQHDALVSSGDTATMSSSADTRWNALATAMARAVRSQCPAWLRDHAEDIAQVALTKVMAAERRAEGERPLSPFYLYRAAHSALVDEIRSRKRRAETPIEGIREGDDEERSFEPRGQDNPESSASFRELGLAVRDCLVNAKRERRLAVTLHLLGHSVPEAARILGWNAKRTENLVYRGLADLRQCLLGKGHRP
jgi:RNA polymerase sigma-70 factor, ECF subfamily